MNRRKQLAQPHIQTPLSAPPVPQPTYTRFNKLDGRHPWQQAVPESYILYPVRHLKNCKVAYFNFNLASEMGLVDANHSHQMNPQLEKQILETFAIQIINEYDREHKKNLQPSKPHPYMATRYLQLQHRDKQGRTSGDGRSVWNGAITHRGQTWDVSSRGTGVTSLAPGVVAANRPLKTGSEEFGYGCGMAEMDELLSSTLMSEIFHRTGVQTERMLAIIEVGKNLAIGVRAAPNLIRPAHLFLHLKQNNYSRLKQSVDYFIERQVQNKAWSMPLNSIRKYDLMAEAVCHDFARFVALLEREYIFMWMDWDGDNCLASGGIIDYGSIRQFGLRHDQYRYDDVERFSTNLNEQKLKARQMLVGFIQIAEYLKTKRKPAVGELKNHPLLNKFDQVYLTARQKHLLYQMGFSAKQATALLTTKAELVEKFETLFMHFEKTKTSKPQQKLPDGINKPAIYNMRNFLRETPRHLSYQAAQPQASELAQYFAFMTTEQMTKKEARLTRPVEKRLNDLLKTYMELVTALSGTQSSRKVLLQIASRAQVTCYAERITGNGVENVVSELLMARKRLGYENLRLLMDAFVDAQTHKPITPNPQLERSLNHLLALVYEFREDI